jgi:hypothetical protein
MTFDVGADVQAWVDGTTNWGWGLNDRDTESGQHRVEYDTTESPQVAERPALSVTYTP